MSIQTALLPHKHVRFADSIVALAGLVRKLLEQPSTVDEVWAKVSRSSTDWPGDPGFTNVVLAIDVLFALKQVESVSDGRIRLVK